MGISSPNPDKGTRPLDPYHLSQNGRDCKEVKRKYGSD